MALRQFARQAVSRCGLQVAPGPLGGSIASEFGFALRATACRSFASVVEGLKYAKSHEWTKVDGDTVTIGISDFAQAELGDVVYVELPEVGSELKKAETFGVVESVKAASDVYSPISGEVLEVNSALVEDPSKVNSSPFEEGWMMKVKLSDPSELEDLMDSATYEKTCEDH